MWLGFLGEIARSGGVRSGGGFSRGELFRDAGVGADEDDAVLLN